jgi:hypothetical protein
LYKVNEVKLSIKKKVGRFLLRGIFQSIEGLESHQFLREIIFAPPAEDLFFLRAEIQKLQIYADAIRCVCTLLKQSQSYELAEKSPFYTEK